MSESLPKDVEGQKESHDETTSPPIESHPTGRIRYSEKRPPVVPSPGSDVTPDASESVPKVSQDHDMEEYEPSSPGEDIPMSEPFDDAESMPMDISSLASRLTPPPEDLIRRQCTSGVISPLFIPTKDSQSITSESFQLCGEKIYLINPLSVRRWMHLVRCRSSEIRQNHGTHGHGST